MLGGQISTLNVRVRQMGHSKRSGDLTSLSSLKWQVEQTYSYIGMGGPYSVNYIVKTSQAQVNYITLLRRCQV